MASTYKGSRLHMAVTRGEIHKIRQYIAAGDDLNSLDNQGFTPLMTSVGLRALSIVRILLLAGADTSIRGPNDLPLLSVAVALGTTLDILEALVKAGADLNAATEEHGTTPLMAAVGRGEIGMAKLLIKAGCDVSKKAADGDTVFYLAALKGHSQLIPILLDGGVDVNETDKEGNTALIKSAAQGHCHTVVKLLECHADVDAAALDGRGALFHAAWRGKDDVVIVLIRARADVNRKDKYLRTPLHVASAGGHQKCAQLLLSAGADVSARDFEGCTALHLAACRSRTHVIELLLAAGADCNSIDYESRAPLDLAAMQTDGKTIHLLVDAGSDIHRLNQYGQTALFLASHLEVVKALLSRGVSASHLDNRGATALHYAGGYHGASTAVLCALYQAGADPTVRSTIGLGNTAAEWARGNSHDDVALMLDLLADKLMKLRGCSEDEIRDYHTERKLTTTIDLSEIDFSAPDFAKEFKEKLGIPVQKGVRKESEEEVKEELKEKTAEGATAPCLNCSAMTSRLCSGCEITHFCSRRCEMAARHVCCG